MVQLDDLVRVTQWRFPHPLIRALEERSLLSAEASLPDGFGPCLLQGSECLYILRPESTLSHPTVVQGGSVALLDPRPATTRPDL